jgi:hypothetical protein
MATDDTTYPDRLGLETIDSTIASVKKMLMLGALFAIVGYLLIIGALVLELTQFHPLLEEYFTQYPNYSLAGGGAEPRSGAINAQLASIHKFPSTLLWMKLGGIGHILVGIFISLAAIVRVLSLMPHRLSYEMERAQD